jgi:hypothetical protein
MGYSVSKTKKDIAYLQFQYNHWQLQQQYLNHQAAVFLGTYLY